MQSPTLESLKAQFPNEWVLLRVDAMEDNRPLLGTVLLHSKDYLELCYKASELAKNILTHILYTGEKSTARKWLKATRLKD